MIYRRFGKTGLEVSVLSAGFMRAMHSWGEVPAADIPAASQANLEDIVCRALELGINHFETARGYGTSEEQLGRALKRIARRDSYLLQTKIQPTDDPAAFRADFLDSLQRLGVARVDLLALHGINDYRGLWRSCRPGGCLAVARDLQRQGLAGSIGFSGHGSLPVIIAALRHEEKGGFDYLNLHWYYICQVNTPALIEAAARDMGVFIISPTDKGGMLQAPPARLLELCRPLSPMAFNDLYCLARDEVSTISIGAARPTDFDAHVIATSQLGQDTDLLQEIDRRCRGAMKEATGHERPEDLWQLLPSWDRTPGLINIPFILWLHNLAQGWGLVEYARKRYAHLGRDVKWVPGNNGAAVRQYDLGRIAARAGMEEVALVGILEEAHRLLGKSGV
ncbi:MAG: aldo/keto reductase [Desulfobulbaceae bacterium]